MRITRSQIRKLIKEQMASQSPIPMVDPDTINWGPQYGHTRQSIKYAPEGLSDTEAAVALRRMFAQAPIWSLKIYKNPKNGKVYAKYEMDTSG